jgi:hypothetical protein
MYFAGRTGAMDWTGGNLVLSVTALRGQAYDRFPLDSEWRHERTQTWRELQKVPFPSTTHANTFHTAAEVTVADTVCCTILGGVSLNGKVFLSHHPV